MRYIIFFVFLILPQRSRATLSGVFSTENVITVINNKRCPNPAFLNIYKNFLNTLAGNCCFIYCVVIVRKTVEFPSCQVLDWDLTYGTTDVFHILFI